MAFIKVSVECPDGHRVASTTVNPDATSTQGQKMCPVCKRRFEWRNERGEISSRWVD